MRRGKELLPALDGPAGLLVSKPGTCYDAKKSARIVFVTEQVAGGVSIPEAVQATQPIMLIDGKRLIPVIRNAQKLTEAERGDLPIRRNRRPLKPDLDGYL